MKVQIKDIDKKTFTDIPRPANRSFDCQACCYWHEKRDGKQDLKKQKKNWFVWKKEKYGSLGKILYLNGEAIGFTQFGPISEFETAKLLYRDKLPLPSGDKAFCITCIAIASKYRGRGLATKLLRNVLTDLKKRGVKSVDGYPVRHASSWNQISVGPLALYQDLGFEIILDEGKRLIVRKRL